MAIRFPNIMLKVANNPITICHSLDKYGKVRPKSRVNKAGAATLEVTEKKATTGIGESESKRRFPIFPLIQNRA